METMKAAVLEGLGGPQLVKVQTIPKPVAPRNNLLIRTAVVDVNLLEAKIRQGEVPSFILRASGAAAVWPPRPFDAQAKPYLKPYITGMDAAGVVESAPAGSRFKKGDRVVVSKASFTDGTAAEFAVAPESEVAKVPANVPLADAVALSMVGMTAFQCLAKIPCKPGSSILINGGAGSVGSVAVQLAAMRGMKVTATASASNADKVKALGAQAVLDYRTVNYEQHAAQASGYDAVLDTVGSSMSAPPPGVLKPGGHFLRLATTFNLKLIFNWLLSRLLALFGLGPRYTVVFMSPNGRELEELMGLMAAGKLKVQIDKSFPLADVSAAHKAIEDGAKGRVLVVVDPTLL